MPFHTPASGVGVSVQTSEIDDDAVTYAKIQNVSATDKVLGRTTAGAGDIEEIATTGSGSVVRATSPTLVTPLLGTPTSGVMTNVTGLTEAGQTLADNTTNDVSTTKHGYAPKAPNDATKFLRGDATWAVPAGSSGVPIALTMTTDYISAARYDSAAGGSGAESFSSNNGAKLDTVSGATSKAGLGWLPLRNGTGSILEGSPVYSTNISVPTLGTDLDSFFGFGNLGTLDGGNRIVYTTTHIGFKILRTASGTASLYATQADGTTENVSSALATVTAGEEFDLIFKINSTTSVDYYTRENGGSLSSATNLTSNLPATLGIYYVQGLIANANTNTQSVVWLGGASFSR